MIKNVVIENLRSIESANIQLAPITVIYGPTSSGKSTLLYSILVLRNFFLNPNRAADGYFHLGFMDLGGIDACVFNHDAKRKVKLEFTYETEMGTASYSLVLGKNFGQVTLAVGSLSMTLEVAIPYALNQTLPMPFSYEGEEFTINWNGIQSTVAPKTPTADTQLKAVEIASSLNICSEVLKAVDIAPHKRGFFKPNYTPVAASMTPTTEDEVGAIIINDPHLPGRISVYCEEIFGRDFRVQVAPGTATAFFQCTDKKSKIPVLLVNEGFGINQVIYQLAKILRTDVSTILIEEPEVHLHPTVARNFARTLCTLARDEEKQIILTTHSEMFLTSLLTMVSEGNLTSSEIKCYLATKDRKTTDFKEQKVQETGQIEGGLSSFVEAELADIKKFLGVQ